jgi:hypothetical protein
LRNVIYLSAILRLRRAATSARAVFARARIDEGDALESGAEAATGTARATARSARGLARLDRRGRNRPAPSFREVTAARKATRERTHRRDGVRGRGRGDALPGGNEM